MDKWIFTSESENVPVAIPVDGTIVDFGNVNSITGLLSGVGSSSKPEGLVKICVQLNKV